MMKTSKTSRYLFLIFHLYAYSWNATPAAALSIPSNPSSSSANRLRQLLSENQHQLSTSSSPPPAIAVPGVHDALSAKIFASQGAKILFLSGFGVSASRLGVPDAGILTRNEMEDATRMAVATIGDSSSSPPLIVDGDTGYGGAANVRRTIRGLAACGAAAITIEDQTFPKKCTYAAGAGISVLSRKECLDRMKCALRSRDEARERDGHDVLVIARTDCRMALGFDEAVQRCKEFQAMGADIVYAENLQSKEEYEMLRRIIGIETPMMLAQVQQRPGQTEQTQTLFTVEEIGQMGYNLALFGVTALQATVGALQSTARQFLHGGGLIHTHDEKESIPMASFENVKGAVGFPELDDFEKEYGCE